MCDVRRGRRPCGALARLAAAIALAAAVVPGAAAVAAVTERVTRTLPLAYGGTLTVEASIAEVRIVGTARRDVKIDVERTVPERTDLARLPLAIDETATGPRVSVRQADGGLDRDLRATVAIELPAAARVEAVDIAEGRLEVEGLTTAIAAVVRRGPIAARRVRGVVRLETGIGDVTVRDAHLDPEGLIRLRTFNGDIDLAFAAAPADARVMALALNGTVSSSSIPLTLKTAWGPRWGEATLGKGEPVVSLDVVTGDIRIEAPAARR